MNQPPVRRLRVDHETRYEYDDAVEIAHHLAYLRPRVTDWQQIQDWRLVIDPAPDDSAPAATPADDHGDSVPAGVRMSQDAWGNWRAAFSHSRVHETLSVRSIFIAALANRPTPDVRRSPAWETVAASLRYRPSSGYEPASEFALPTRFAPRASSLARFGLEAFLPGQSLASGALSLMHQVHQRFEYRPASTSVGTVAPESLAQLRGVCQDFSHVMIGAMRSLGLAARYVSGYLLTHPPPGRPRLVGADATHAWVEAWCPVNGWIALDPTNGVLAGQDHVTVAWGRDYADVAPLRGVIRGGGQVSPTVAVTVEPLPVASSPRCSET